jgi:hypothetical protein
MAHDRDPDFRHHRRLNRHLQGVGTVVVGRVRLRVSSVDIEAVTSRPITAGDPLTSTVHRNGTKSDTKRTQLGDGRIPRALLEADIATLQLALKQRQKEEIQSILE